MDQGERYKFDTYKKNVQQRGYVGMKEQFAKNMCFACLKFHFLRHLERKSAYSDSTGFCRI